MKIKQKTGDIIKYALSFVLAGVLVYFAFRGVNWNAFLDGLKHTRWSMLILYVIFTLITFFFRERRWTALLRSVGNEHSHIAVWEALNIGNIVNLVLPGAGEVTRCAYVSNKKVGFDKNFGTLICERLPDVILNILLFVVALVLGWGKYGTFFNDNILEPIKNSLSGSFWWLVSGIVLFIALFILAVHRWKDSNRLCAKIASAISGVKEGFISFSKMENKWLLIFHSVMLWLSYIFTYWAVAWALPETANLSFADMVFLTAVGCTASIVPVPGSIGAYHYLMALCLQTIFLTSWDIGILYATLEHETHAVLLGVLGIITYFCIMARKKAKQKDGKGKKEKGTKTDEATGQQPTGE